MHMLPGCTDEAAPPGCDGNPPIQGCDFPAQQEQDKYPACITCPGCIVCPPASSLSKYPLRVSSFYSSAQSYRRRESVSYCLLLPKAHTQKRNEPEAAMAFAEAHYHPFLFGAMMLAGFAELGLTAFLISAGNENGTWPRPRYHAL